MWHQILAEVTVPTGGAESGLRKITSVGFLVVAGICLVIAIYVTRWISGIFSWLASIPRILLVIVALAVLASLGVISFNFKALAK